jgi:hypothetical protein
MLIATPSFVIQRRIPHPLSAVHSGLADRKPLGSTELLALGADGYLHVSEPFRPMTPNFSPQSSPTWRAPACLLTKRARVVALIEVEVSMWSHDSTDLQLRPVARHPERWSSRRIGRYFALAHPGADEIARLLAQRVRATGERRVLAAITAARIPTANIDADRVGSRR